MRRILRVLAAALLGLSACTVTVPSPDLAVFQGDDGVTDLGADPGLDPGKDLGVDPGKDPGPLDPGSFDPGTDLGPVDPGQADPGPFDPGPEDVPPVIPQLGGAACTVNEGCVSGECLAGRCTCRTAADCEKGLWCDAGDTKFRGTLNCQLPRQNFAGCTSHVQCKTGACDPQGYCANCAKGGTGCNTTAEPPEMCCGGNCETGCLGCAVAPPPAPELTFCAAGCYDATVQYCAPGLPEKLPVGKPCEFNDSWCRSGFCKLNSTGTDSRCACVTDADCKSLGLGAVCLKGGCAMP